MFTRIKKRHVVYVLGHWAHTKREGGDGFIYSIYSVYIQQIVVWGYGAFLEDFKDA